jgi:phage tail sheath protein FI
MAFQVSPGVEVKEIDATNVIPAVATSIGGTAGIFRWGPCHEITTVSSEKQLVEIFGAPTTTASAESFFPAAGFLKYGSTLRVVRAKTTGQASAGDAAAFTSTSYDDGANYGTNNWIARCPGALGNSLTVITCRPGTSDSQFNEAAFASYTTYFNGAPGTSDFAQSITGSSTYNDEVHVVVVDSGGEFTGSKGTVLETFGYMSVGKNAKASDGTSNYFKDVINTKSQYIRFGKEETRSAEFGTVVSAISSSDSDITALTGSVSTSELSGGDDGAAGDSIRTALELFANDALVDINLLFAQGDLSFSADSVNSKLIEIAESRKDIVSFVSPPCAVSKVSNPMSTTEGVFGYYSQAGLSTSSSYVVADSTALYIYDKYNDTYRYITANGHIAGLCANTDRVADAWFSPAGQNRGQLLGVTKLAFNPDKSQRDDLYRARINPLVAFPGSGIQLFGDKTRLAKPSAFDRINVRRLFIALEKAISTAAESQLFEFNDEFTRAGFRNMVEPFLREVKGRRGITDFLVVCDETNNTGNVIDTNRFVADIYIKPARSINFITLNFIATPTGVEFSEIAGQ